MSASATVVTAPGAAPGPTPGAPPLLEMAGVSKSFGPVRALDDVRLTLRAGEVHALMGENGAGKSTLIKVLTGVHRADGGVMRLNGASIAPASPAAAEAVGISTVYQEVNLIPTLSVAENLCLGRFPGRWGVVNWRAAKRRARAALARLDVSLDVSRPLGAYSLALQQLVAIARALDAQAKLLILDEPTSSLDEQEVDDLLGLLGRLRAQGLGILFVSHFMDQVYRISDRITVLRNGRFVSEARTKDLSRIELIGQMVGKDTATLEAQEAEAAARHRAGVAGAAPLLETEGLGRGGSVEGLSFAVPQGRTVGLVGLLGSGRTEAARLLFGVDAADRGVLRWASKPVVPRSPREAIRLGLAMTPEDRKNAGIVPNLSVRENIVLALQSRQGLWRRVAPARQREIADRYIRALGIKTPDREQLIKNLSGGNQQKVLLARWLAVQPRLFILDEPTRGIDVGAKADIERLIHELAADGMSVLFISSEMDEVIRVSDRVVVMRDRRQVGCLEGQAIQESVILKQIAATESELAGELAAEGREAPSAAREQDDA